MAQNETSSGPAHPLIESDRIEGTAVYDANGKQIGTVKRLVIEKVRTHAGTSESGFDWGECLGASSHRLIDEIRFRRGSGSATRRQHALTSRATSFTHNTPA